MTPSACILSLNVGLPANVIYDGNQTMKSGILKRPVSGKVLLGRLGFEGDGSADRVNHGGEEKAVCVYCHDHYPYWERELSKKLSPGAFGENLTMTGLTEDKVHIGDIYRVGEATVQCSQPRQPCHKLNKIYGLQDMAARVQHSGFTGFYLRVLESGLVEAGSKVELLQKGDENFSISAANQLMYGDDKWNYIKIRAILALKFLSISWKDTFQKRLDNREVKDVNDRLQGT